MLWRQFASGPVHSAALTDDGGLFAMGANWDGQFGRLEIVGETNRPTRVPFPPGVTSWKHLALSDSITWLVDQGDRLWRTVPLGALVKFPDVPAFAKMQMATSPFTVHALRSDGELIEFRSDEPPVVRPVGVGRWTDFAATLTHTVGIGSNRQLYACSFSQSPVRNWAAPVFPVSTAPRRAPSADIEGWTRVAANPTVTLAADTARKLYSWGVEGYTGSVETPTGECGSQSRRLKPAGWTLALPHLPPSRLATRGIFMFGELFPNRSTRAGERRIRN